MISKFSRGEGLKNRILSLVLCLVMIISSLFCGFEAFAVGGCVRDMILGVEPKDYDITTNAKPDEIKDCLKEY